MVPSPAEIKEVIAQMNPASSPGSDGFTGYFYMACWEIIETDLCDFVTDFFKGAYNPKEITTTLILIPKIPAARKLGDFRPISLVNFSGKIISKIRAMRLAKLLSKIVSEEQAGFVKDRNISTHIAMAQELVSDLSRKVTGGNVIFKIDMAKAYDRLEWRFLLRALQAFGFSPAARDIIYRNIANICYNFRINGEITGNFHSTRGVRQGYPLSPLLFVLAQVVLSFNLNRRIAQLNMMPYKVGRNKVSVSHLFYADDVLLFTNGSDNSLRNLMQLLQAYEKSSGQSINRNKNGFFIHNKYQRQAPIIARITGLSRQEFPFTYLGLPIFYGRSKAIYYEPLEAKVRNTLKGWKSKLLSFGGRITLIKSVLAT